MNCFPCFQNRQQKEGNSNNVNDDVPTAEPTSFTTPPPPVNNNLRPNPPVDSNKIDDVGSAEGENFAVKVFNFRELAIATKNFRQECLLGEGGFGRVFRGTLMPSGQIVAVRQLDRNGTQGSKEFQVEVSSLSRLNHPNLVKLIGYCADGEQRILVYEYVPSGSLKNHLFEVQSGRKPLDWTARMKIASGIAQGLEYLHERAEPPIIYRDLRSSNVLLDETSNPRLSEYGLAKLVQGGNKMHAAPSVMAASGYCAPECERHGESTVKSDVYSFGVILLELITGRRALDVSKPADEQSLVSWAQPIFRDPTKFPEMADPNLRNVFPVTSLNQAVGVAAMCLQEEPLARPLISDVSAALAFLAMAPPEAPIPARLVPILSSRVDSIGQFGDCNNSMRSSNFSSYHKRDHSRSSNSSDDEDEEDRERLASMKRKGKIDSSSSLRKIESRSNSRSSGRRSNSSDRSSIDSRDYSMGFSLRCDSNVRSLHSNSRQDDIIHEDRDDYSDNSSSDDDDDEWNDSGYNRNCSRQESRATSIGSSSFKHSSKNMHHQYSDANNISSSIISRQRSFGSSSGDDESGSSRRDSGKISSRKYYHDGDKSMRSEDGPELTDSESDEDSDH